MITAAQCRAARGLLDWSQADLASKAGVEIVTVRQFEAAAHEPRRATLDVMLRAFQAAGVEFTNGDQPGVRLAKTAVVELRRARHKDQEKIGLEAWRNACHRRSRRNQLASQLQEKRRVNLIIAKRSQFRACS